MSYRIRYVSDGGPVSSDNHKGWPCASKSFKTLLGVMKALRDVVNSDPRIGTELGVGVQFRFFGGPWRYMSTKDINKSAIELNLKNWAPL